MNIGTYVWDNEVHPYVVMEWFEEGEDGRSFALLHPVENTDSQIHEGSREVYHILSQIIDRQRRHCQVRFLNKV